MTPLAILPGMGYSEGVRCGNLAIEPNEMDRPREFLGGACVDESVLGLIPQVQAPDSAHARAMPLLSVCGVFSWPKHFDPQSGLAMGCFVVVNAQADARVRIDSVECPTTCQSESGSTKPEISAGHHHKASLGPEWAALKKHRHRETRPVQAVQPVSEGLKMPSRQVVRQTGCADGIAAPRVRWGVLRCGLNVGWAPEAQRPKVVGVGFDSRACRLHLQSIWAGQGSMWCAFTLGVTMSERKA